MFSNSIYTLKNSLHVPHKLICISVLPNIQNLIYRNPSPTRFCERRLSRGRGLHWDPFLHPCRPAATESQSHPGPRKEERDHPSRPGQGFSPFSLFKIGLIWWYISRFAARGKNEGCVALLSRILSRRLRNRQLQCPRRLGLSTTSSTTSPALHMLWTAPPYSSRGSTMMERALMHFSWEVPMDGHQSLERYFI